MGLEEFLTSSPSPWHAATSLTDCLRQAGFHAVLPGNEPPGGAGGYLRRGASVVAWRTSGSARAPLRVAAAHVDSPGLRLRPLPQRDSPGVRLLSTEVYGSALYHSFLDRPLAVAGQVAYLTDGRTEVREVRLEADVLIPSLAIHLDREVNQRGLTLDPNGQLDAVWDLSGGGDFLTALARAAHRSETRDLLSWDLVLSESRPPFRWGASGRFLSSGRLDDLAGCHALLEAFLQTPPTGATLPVAVWLDGEEVGSQGSTGADSDFVPSIVRALAMSHPDVRGASGWIEARNRGHFLSLDAAHGRHPLRPERHDPAHAPLLGSGPALKVHAGWRYAGDAASRGRIVRLARELGVPLQVFAMRADLACGSTVGPILAAGLAMSGVDIGTPLWGMHSAVETMCFEDHPLTIALVRAHLSSGD